MGSSQPNQVGEVIFSENVSDSVSVTNDSLENGNVEFSWKLSEFIQLVERST